MKVKAEIKKLKIDFLSFLTGDAKPSNQFEYILAKSDLEGRKFELESDGEHVNLTINKSLKKEEAERLSELSEELNVYWSKFPPALSNAVIELVKMAGAVKAEKTEIAGLDQLEALILKTLGKKEKKGPFDSVPDSFLPPQYQADLAKKKVMELKKVIENEDEDPDVKLPRKGVRKQISGHDESDDDVPDEDALPGMPVLSGFLEYHRPPVKED